MNSNFIKVYDEKIEELRKLTKAAKSFETAMQLALNVHAMTHTGVVSDSLSATYVDELINGLKDHDFIVMPTEKDETIAWHLWHIARIEDIVGNLLIAKQPQIFNEQWMKRMNVSVKDTGNAMSDEEIIKLSIEIDKKELINYRNTVGTGTRKIIKNLSYSDLKRKPEQQDLQRIVAEGGLTEDKNSIWLKDFWGRLTIGGTVLLPLTRHHMMHLPDSYRIKETIYM